MNIGIVCYPTFGGSGIVATELGMQLAREGHHVDFISYKIPARLEFVNSNIHFHQVLVEDYPLFKHQPYMLALATKICEAALSHNLEILHVHYAIPHAFAACMARDMLRDKNKDIKIVTTLHGTDITLVGSHPSYKMAVEYSINHSDAVTAVSESLKNSTYENFEIKKEIEVISNFIDAKKIRSEGLMGCAREQFVSSIDEKLVVHVSNLRPVKRVQDVVAIFNKIHQKVKSKLLILGEGPDLELAIQLVKQYGIQEDVKFLGNHNNVYTVLCAADLVLLPSQTESFGLVALEAMATGTPVIASNAGGLPEVIEEGVSGYLCEVGDVDDMSDKAIDLFEHPDKLNKMKQAALDRAQYFDIKRIVPQYEALYKKCLES